MSPIYEFECRECENIAEVRVPMGRDRIDACARCGGEMKRIVSRCALVMDWDTRREKLERADRKKEMGR